MTEELADKMSEDVVNARKELLVFVHDRVSAIASPTGKVMAILGYAAGASTLLKSSKDTMPPQLVMMLASFIEVFERTDAEALALDAMKPKGGVQ